MKRILLLAAMAAFAWSARAQNEDLHVFHVHTWQTAMPEGGRASERDSIVMEYFDKVTMKHPGVLHQWNLRHYFTEDSREWVIIDEYKSFKDMAAADTKWDELEKTAWPDEKTRMARFDRFRLYFPSHSDKIFSDVTGLQKLGAAPGESHLYNLQTWYMVSKPGMKRADRDSLFMEYHAQVTMQIPGIISERHMQHYYTEDSREYVILTEIKELSDMQPVIDKIDEMEKTAWPDEKKRMAMLDKMDNYFTHHSDRLYRSVPKMAK